MALTEKEIQFLKIQKNNGVSKDEAFAKLAKIRKVNPEVSGGLEGGFKGFGGGQAGAPSGVTGNLQPSRFQQGAESGLQGAEASRQTALGMEPGVKQNLALGAAGFQRAILPTTRGAGEAVLGPVIEPAMKSNLAQGTKLAATLGKKGMDYLTKPLSDFFTNAIGRENIEANQKKFDEWVDENEDAMLLIARTVEAGADLFGGGQLSKQVGEKVLTKAGREGLKQTGKEFVEGTAEGFIKGEAKGVAARELADPAIKAVTKAPVKAAKATGRAIGDTTEFAVKQVTGLD
ncbi:hypothetical protein KJ781_04290, partial [Patescibacteria group bacterium]|nr:hypothetical protein [Patescibacteria group bacterium]